MSIVTGRVSPRKEKTMYKVKHLRQTLGSDAGAWRAISKNVSLGEAQKSLSEWRGPALLHGDLVNIVGDDGGEGLFVFDGDKLAFAKSTSISREMWSGHDSNAREMLLACDGVDRRRLAMAAASCAAMSFDAISEGNGDPVEAVRSVRGWFAGDVDIDQLRERQRECAEVASRSLRGDFKLAASASAAASACATVTSRSGDAHKFAAQTPAYAADAMVLDRASQSRDADNRALVISKMHGMASIVRRWIPLSVAVCASLGLRDPLPIPRDNPRRRR